MTTVKVITNKNQEAVKAFMLKDEVWFTFCDDSSDKDEYQPPFGSRAVWLDIIVDGDFAGMVLVENDNLSTLRVHPYLLKQYRKHVREFFNRFFIMFMKTPDHINKLIVSIPSHRRIVYNTALKVGFVDEGINRASFLKDGHFLDQWNLGLTKKEVKKLL